MPAHLKRRSWSDHFAEMTVRGLMGVRNFRGRYRLIRYASRFATSARSAYGPTMLLRYGDQTNQFALTASYGNGLANRIRRLPTDAVFLDIGANLGIFTLIAASHLRRGFVVAFEPNRIIFSDLVQNLSLNGSENVLPLNVGIGSQTRLGAMRVESGHSGTGFVELAASAGCTPVLLLGPEGLAFLNKIVAGRTVFVKIDVEGAELEVICALDRSGVLEHVESLFVEIDDNLLRRFGTNSGEVYATLSRAGLRANGNQKPGHHYDELFSRAVGIAA